MTSTQALREKFRRLTSTRPVNTIVSRNEFRHAAKCERLRVNRSDHASLTIVLITILSPREDLEDATVRLGKIMAPHLSIIDTAGRYTEQRVGILLPNCSADHAHQLISQLDRSCESAGLAIRIETLRYPEDSFDETDGPQKSGESSAHVAEAEHDAASTVGVFFSTPVPFWKRTLDIVASSALLLLTSPLLVVGAALVKASSSGTLLFCQERIGHGGRKFTIYKIRTMKMNADKLVDDLRHRSEQDGPAFKLKKDPRVIPMGRMLRLLSIDELPQLWNVLRGDMSLVGPRPLPTSEAKQLSRLQQERQDVLPGVTGTWQVSGRNSLSFEQWMRMDINYARTHSIWSDLRIILLTVPAVIFCRGAS